MDKMAQGFVWKDQGVSHLNIKMLSDQYRDSRYGNPYTGQTTSLYWDGHYEYKMVSWL